MRTERFSPGTADRILVVAPHPDDDVLACGGTLALAAGSGAEVRVVYLTDGGASHPGSRLTSRAELRDIRETEAVAALEVLGISAGAAVFLRGRDGELEPFDAGIAGRLAAELERFAPTIVFAPFERDPHPDHRSAAALAGTALAVTGLPARHFAYTVWLDVRGTESERWTAADGRVAVVETAATLERKRQAIAAHRSQLGLVVGDDPSGFRLPHDLIAACCRDEEQFLVIASHVARQAAAS